MYTTYQDAIDNMTDFLGGNPEQTVVRDCKRAVLNAYRDLINAHNWTYLYTHGRLNTVVPIVSSGGGPTLQYQHTSGTYPRQVTISGGTWPSWANMAYLRVGVVNYLVSRVVSATVLTLDAEVNPGADLAAGTPFTLYQDSFVLPDDFVSQDQGLFQQNFGGMSYVHPREWLFQNRYVLSLGAVSQFYTFRGDRRVPGRLVASFFPIPQVATSIDFIYKRRPRDLTIANYAAGTVSVAGSAVTGSGTMFAAPMVGSVLRCSASSTPPTSPVKLNPAVFESVIQAQTSGTSVTTADAAVTGLSGVAYTVSDPVDITQGAMLTAFTRGCEYQLGILRSLKDRAGLQSAYYRALEEARSADSRSFTARFEGEMTHYRQRLRDMPLGPDQS